MNLNFDHLTIGDRLVRMKGGVFTKHHALYAGFDLNTNEQLVAENQVKHGVRVITLTQFLSEGKLVKIEYHNFPRNDQNLVIDRINARLGKAYDLVHYNCEHFVNEVLHGKASSVQVAKGIGIGLGLLALLFISTSSRKAA